MNYNLNCFVITITFVNLGVWHKQRKEKKRKKDNQNFYRQSGTISDVLYLKYYHKLCIFLALICKSMVQTQFKECCLSFQCIKPQLWVPNTALLTWWQVEFIGPFPSCKGQWIHLFCGCSVGTLFWVLLGFAIHRASATLQSHYAWSTNRESHLACHPTTLPTS